MATLVFRLKYVPEEEADDIRQLLAEHDIEFYETSAGRWQISMAGIWVRDKQQAEQARVLIREDQLERSRDMKTPNIGEYLLGYFQHARQNPAEALFTLLAIGLILSVSILPFLLSS
ncbi:hypothetical protein OA79_09105 [Marinomonas sp. TW1]|nr:hypothetical protein OA79_09105 [Marinomonas sp. TW1]